MECFEVRAAAAEYHNYASTLQRGPCGLGCSSAGALVEHGSDAQYSAARIVRHLALDGSADHKDIAVSFLPALVRSMQVQACA